MSTERILEVALRLFGERGFDGVSTREIAAASGTAMSAITYHFGSKQGLYLAVADHVASGMAASKAPILAEACKALCGSRAAAADALVDILESFARSMLAPESCDWANFIVREMRRPTEAFERIYSGALGPLIETCVALVEVALPDLGPKEARATAIFLHGQALILRIGSTMVERLLEATPIDTETEDLLIRRLRAQSLAILTENPPR